MNQIRKRPRTDVTEPPPSPVLQPQQLREIELIALMLENDAMEESDWGEFDDQAMLDVDLTGGMNIDCNQVPEASPIISNYNTYRQPVQPPLTQTRQSQQVEVARGPSLPTFTSLEMTQKLDLALMSKNGEISYARQKINELTSQNVELNAKLKAHDDSQSQSEEMIRLKGQLAKLEAEAYFHKQEIRPSQLANTQAASQTVVIKAPRKKPMFPESRNPPRKINIPSAIPPITKESPTTGPSFVQLLIYNKTFSGLRQQSQLTLIAFHSQIIQTEDPLEVLQMTFDELRKGYEANYFCRLLIALLTSNPTLILQDEMLQTILNLDVGLASVSILLYLISQSGPVSVSNISKRLELHPFYTMLTLRASKLPYEKVDIDTIVQFALSQDANIRLQSLLLLNSLNLHYRALIESSSNISILILSLHSFKDYYLQLDLLFELFKGSDATVDLDFKTLTYFIAALYRITISDSGKGKAKANILLSLFETL